MTDTTRAPAARPRRKRVATWYERLTLPRAVATILAIATLLVLAAGALARAVEPSTFTSLGTAYWWALTTVTTVGYGDVVPHDTAGRLVGSALMLTGLGLIPTITSVVVALLISKRAAEENEDERADRAAQAARLARIEEILARRDGPPGA